MRTVLWSVLALLTLAVVFAALWLGLVPRSLNPMPVVNLAERPGWLTDFRLAALRRDGELCRSLLVPSHIEAAPVPDSPFRKMCGWRNAVRVSSIAGSTLSVEPLTCEMAAATALWVTHELKPAAREILGSEVTAIEDYGTYDCRNIVGNAMWSHKISEHASANALDIAGFTLADGRRIGVAKHWQGSGPEARFLHEAHRRSCRYFRVSLSPDFNKAHADHFHFDRGVLSTCR